MATLVKDSRKRSPFWYCCYSDATGRRLKKSTKQKVKAKAVEVCRSLERAETLAREGALTEIRAREILSEVLERVTGKGLRVFTVRQWLEHCLALKKKSRSSKTAARHEQMMNEFLAFLGRRADLNIAAVTSKDIADFRDARERQGLAPATVNLDITILSSAFNAAQRQGHARILLESLTPAKMKKKHFIVFIVATVAATMLTDCAVAKDFPEPSLEELAAVDSQLADAFVAYAKTPAGRDNSASFLEASEVFRQRAKDEAHIKPVVPKSRELAAALATGDQIATAKLNVLAQHAPLPRIAALYRNIALVFVDRSEMDNPIGLPPMKFLPPAPDLIIPESLE